MVIDAGRVARALAHSSLGDASGGAHVAVSEPSLELSPGFISKAGASRDASKHAWQHLERKTATPDESKIIERKERDLNDS